MFAEFLPFHGVILHRCLFTFWPSKKKLLSGNISKNNFMALYKAFTFWQLSLSSTNLLFVLEIRPWAGLRGVAWEGKDKALLILSRYV